MLLLCILSHEPRRSLCPGCRRAPESGWVSDSCSQVRGRAVDVASDNAPQRGTVTIGSIDNGCSSLPSAFGSEKTTRKLLFKIRNKQRRLRPTPGFRLCARPEYREHMKRAFAAKRRLPKRSDDFLGCAHRTSKETECRSSGPPSRREPPAVSAEAHAPGMGWCAVSPIW